MNKQKYLDLSLDDAVFAIFDTETTGNNSFREDKPIELAVVPWNLKKGFLDKPKSWLINPGIPIHPSAIMVHGLFDEDVEKAPSYEQVVPEFLKYIQNWTLVAHNISFDVGMVPDVNDLDNLQLDMLRFARQIYKKGDLGYKDMPLTSHKSQELRYWLNIKVDTMGLNAHRAAADILVTGEVFAETLKRAIKRSNLETLGELLEFINAPILIEKFTFSKFYGQSIDTVIREECAKNNNFFHWLYREVAEGRRTINPDEQYSIEYYMKKNNINVAGYYIKKNEKIKSWSDVTNRINN